MIPFPVSDGVGLDGALASVPAAPTYFYAAFGGVVRSDLELPELLPAMPMTSPDLILRVVERAPENVSVALLGKRQIGAEQYTLWRTPTGLRLHYSHSGTFDVSADGAHIVWYARRDVLLEHVRNIVIGPVASLALELAGLLCLHGSGVAIDGGAVAFLGPKYFGKSTLATTLVAAGAQLIGDDLLAVQAGPPAIMRPGVPSVRLWSDMAAKISVAAATRISGIKTTVTGFETSAVRTEPAPIRAIYLLSPEPKQTDAPAARRTRLRAVDATIGLAHQTKLPDCLVGFRAAGSRLNTAASLASTVPVWTLHVVRDAMSLNVVAEQILDWSRAQ